MVDRFCGLASIILSERNFNRDWIERQLAHSERDSVRAPCNHAEYLPERRKMMMQWWGGSYSIGPG
uniref:Integrase n=1 Tax=Burkholderia cenocepacia TaxID=95486 RepID=A0A071M553_9BURK